MASEIAIMAHRSEHPKIVETRYDDELLQCLKDVNPSENNFIIINGMGSHNGYSNRYPKERIVFEDDDIEAEYSNAIRYVDDLLKDRYLSFYTNDMIYNTLCGLIMGESNYYDATEDFSNFKYNKSLKIIKTFGGKKKVSDDSYLYR